MLHYTHQGITNTLAQARSSVYWPGLAHDLLKLCRECEICAEDHADPSLTTTSHSEAFGLEFKYCTDIGEIDGFLHQIVIDYYSFAIFEHPLLSLAANSVITAFKNHFFQLGCSHDFNH